MNKPLGRDARTSMLRGKKFPDPDGPCIIDKIREDVASRPIDFESMVEAIQAEIDALDLAYAVERDNLLKARHAALEAALAKKHIEDELVLKMRNRAIAEARRVESEIYTSMAMGDPPPERAGRVPPCEEDLSKGGRERSSREKFVPKKITLPRVKFLERDE